MGWGKGNYYWVKGNNLVYFKMDRGIIFFNLIDLLFSCLLRVKRWCNKLGGIYR